MEIKLSLDSGRFATKRAYYHPINKAMVKKSIPTLFTEIGYNELSGNSLRVEYKGSLYAVGGNLPYELIEENSKLVKFAKRMPLLICIVSMFSPPFFRLLREYKHFKKSRKLKKSLSV